MIIYYDIKLFNIINLHISTCFLQKVRKSQIFVVSLQSED